MYISHINQRGKELIWRYVYIRCQSTRKSAKVAVCIYQMSVNEEKCHPCGITACIYILNVNQRGKVLSSSVWNLFSQHYHTQVQKKRKFEPRIKFHHNVYSWRLAGVLIFPCIIETPCVFHSFSWMVRCTMLWKTRLLKNWTKTSVSNLYNFLVYYVIYLQFRVAAWKFYRLDLLLIPHLARSVVATRVVYMKHR